LGCERIRIEVIHGVVDSGEDAGENKSVLSVAMHAGGWDGYIVTCCHV
jgi:hypothetical protein